jgi:hypothetical protein
MTEITIPNENPDLETVFITDQDCQDERTFIGKNVVMGITGVTAEGEIAI